MAILAGNWKLYKTRKDVETFFDSLADIDPAGHECYVAPSPSLLETACRKSQEKGNKIGILSQNLAYKLEGALTGETSVKQLLELGVKGSIVAHSERRQFFGETNETAAERCKIGLEHGLKILFCIGENLDERKQGRFEKVIEAQLLPLFKIADAFSKEVLQKQLVLAYEPVWAIGTGMTATNEEIAASHDFIYKLCSKAGFDLSILYGGSVKPDNLGAISSIPRVNGALVGGASLEPKSYRELLACLTRPLRSPT